MKFLRIIVLTIFLNFMALPSLATIFDWNLPMISQNMTEEESQHSPLLINEKSLPKTLNVHDFLNFFRPDLPNKSFVLADDSLHLAPFLTIFSPPPKV